MFETAKFEFENGSPEKKGIFADLGSNLTLNFGKLFVVKVGQPLGGKAATFSGHVPRKSTVDKITTDLN